MKILYYGTFKLKSGKVSNFYLDLKKAYGNPEILNLICGELTEYIENLEKKPTVIATSGYGGIPLASIVSLKTNIPLTLVRDISKDHGNISKINGYVPNEKDEIIIIDDVFSSGTNIKQMIENLKPTKAKILGAVVVIHRCEEEIEIPIYFLIKIDEII